MPGLTGFRLPSSTFVRGPVLRQDRVDRLGHRGDRRHAVDAVQQPLFRVVVNNRRRLHAIRVKSLLQRRGIVEQYMVHLDAQPLKKRSSQSGSKHFLLARS